MNQNTEQEWQFVAEDLGATRSWLAAQSHQPTERRFEAQPTLELDDTYYDSPDWMIFRAGFALRIRRERAAATGEQTEITLKSLRQARGSLAIRTEITERVNTTDLAAVLARREGIGERIRELVGTRTLSPLFHAHTRRERQRLLEAENSLPLAEVDLDETLIETAAGVSRQLTRVEVECINAVPAALMPWVEQLRDAAHLRPVEGSKFRAGLNAAGLDPTAPLALGSFEISGSQPCVLSQLALLRRYFAAMLAQEPLVRAGSGTAVHEMRVAARHIEVLLRSFEGTGPAWIHAARDTVRGLVKALGAVRDCDVQLEFLDRRLADLAKDERTAVEPMREGLSGQRLGARARLLRTLDGEPLRLWMEMWLSNLPADPVDLAPGLTTAEMAQGLIRGLARKMRKGGDRLRDDAAADDYHQVRIRAKRLRYTLDAFANLYGEAGTDYLRALGKLQTVLGDFHDVTVRTSNFTALVARGPALPTSTSFMVGRLVERDAEAFERCRRKFPKAYKRLTRRRWRSLVKAMRAQAQRAQAPTPARETP